MPLNKIIEASACKILRIAILMQKQDKIKPKLLQKLLVNIDILKVNGYDYTKTLNLNLSHGNIIALISNCPIIFNKRNLHKVCEAIIKDLATIN